MKMSPLMNTLLEVAEGDTAVLRSLDRAGDDFSIPRDVDFTLTAESKESAEHAADVINDLKYGEASVLDEEGTYCIKVVIFTPIMQNIIQSISGFMQLFAESQGLKYEGWGCMVQKR